MKTKEKNNILKIILIVVGVLALGFVLFFLFGSDSYDRENGGGVTDDSFIKNKTQEEGTQTENGMQEQGTETIKDNERETQPQAEINDNQVSPTPSPTEETQEQTDINDNQDNGRESLISDKLEYYDDGKLKSNYSVNSDGEGWVFKYYVKSEVSISGLANTLNLLDLLEIIKDKELNGKGEIISYYEERGKAVEFRGTFKK